MPSRRASGRLKRDFLRGNWSAWAEVVGLADGHRAEVEFEDGRRWTLPMPDRSPVAVGMRVLVANVKGESRVLVPGQRLPDGSESIFVELLGEGVRVWRPVWARPEGDRKTFRLPPTAPAGESWRYPPGSLVRCTIEDLGDGPVRVATEAIE